MIVRRYGSTVQSVVPNFDAHAMTEIGFTRTREFSASAEEFEAAHERLDGHELSATTSGDVQNEVEAAVLEQLQNDLLSLEQAQDGNILVIENRQGVDPPKTRGDQTTRIVKGVNRALFQYAVDPPLKVGIYRRKDG